MEITAEVMSSDEDSEFDLFRSTKEYCNANKNEELSKIIKSNNNIPSETKVTLVEPKKPIPSIRAKKNVNLPAKESLSCPPERVSEAVETQKDEVENPTSFSTGSRRSSARLTNKNREQTQKSSKDRNKADETQKTRPKNRKSKVGTTQKTSNASVSTEITENNNESAEIIDLTFGAHFPEEIVLASGTRTRRSGIQSKKGRARKDYVNQLAGKANVLGCIDLDSDDEKKRMKKQAEYEDLNSSFETDNPELKLNLKWKNTYEQIPHRRFQKFIDLMEFLAKRENTNAENIILVLNNRIITPEDTPDTINYKFYEFITGRAVPGGLGPLVVLKKDKDEIKIKVQIEGRKKRLMFSLKKMQPFKILYIKCSEELKTECANIKLSFDGEHLGLSDTPNSLEFEGDEIIDCRILNQQF